MRPAFCKMLATSETLVRRTPSICARNSWVSPKVSLPERSRVHSSQRASRASTLCDALQAADCWACASRILLVADQRGPEIGAPFGGGLQRRDVQDRSGAGDLNDPGVQRDLVNQRSRSSNHAVAADHRGLDPLAIGQIDDQRDHAAVRKIGPVDRVARIKQQILTHQFERLEMRAKKLEIRRRQGCQQSIGVLTRSHRALRMNEREHGRLSTPGASKPSGAAAGIFALYEFAIYRTSVL